MEKMAPKKMMKYEMASLKWYWWIISKSPKISKKSQATFCHSLLSYSFLILLIFLFPYLLDLIFYYWFDNKLISLFILKCLKIKWNKQYYFEHEFLFVYFVFAENIIMSLQFLCGLCGFFAVSLLSLCSFFEVPLRFLCSNHNVINRVNAH